MKHINPFYGSSTSNGGTPGPKGDPGVDGLDGKAGSVWRDGTTIPANTLGINDDWYINRTTQDVYRKETGAYTLKFNIRGLPGTDGINGTNGVDGATWRSGSSIPANTLGKEGDFYLVETSPTLDVFKRTAGVYSIIASLKGAKGDKGDTGQGVPVGGTTGQILIKSSSTNYASEWQNKTVIIPFSFNGNGPATFRAPVALFVPQPTKSSAGTLTYSYSTNGTTFTPVSVWPITMAANSYLRAVASNLSGTDPWIAASCQATYL